jgi:hypothetical protein
LRSFALDNASAISASTSMSQSTAMTPVLCRHNICRLSLERCIPEPSNRGAPKSSKGAITFFELAAYIGDMEMHGFIANAIALWLTMLTPLLALLTALVGSWLLS